MAAVKAKNTKPELMVRRALHARGFRYTLHRKDLPGKPDIVLPKYKAVIFVNGCFWHGHDCSAFSWPRTRADFWRNKIEGNIARDLRNEALLSESRWRVATVWECSLKGKTKRGISSVADEIETWLLSVLSEFDSEAPAKRVL